MIVLRSYVKVLSLFSGIVSMFWWWFRPHYVDSLCQHAVSACYVSMVGSEKCVCVCIHACVCVYVSGWDGDGEVGHLC